MVAHCLPGHACVQVPDEFCVRNALPSVSAWSRSRTRMEIWAGGTTVLVPYQNSTERQFGRVRNRLHRNAAGNRRGVGGMGRGL